MKTPAEKRFIKHYENKLEEAKERRHYYEYLGCRKEKSLEEKAQWIDMALQQERAIELFVKMLSEFDD